MFQVTTAYPNLRAGLNPSFLEVSDERLDALVAELYGPGVGAEDVEGFFDDLGRGLQSVARGAAHVVQQAAPMVQHALPAIAQGAATGSALGPWGALAGAIAGGAGSLMSQSGNPTLRGIGQAVGGVTQLAGSLTGGGAARGGVAGALGQLAGSSRGGAAGGAAGGFQGATGLASQVAGLLGGGGSANALLGLLARPETAQALSAAALGAYGRNQVAVGQQQVPVQSILGALGTLAGHAAHEAEAIGESLPAHYYGADGELAIDPASPDQRAGALLELFINTPSEWVAEDSGEAGEYEPGEDAYGAQDAAYDEWLVASEADWSPEYDEHEEHFHAW